MGSQLQVEVVEVTEVTDLIDTPMLMGRITLLLSASLSAAANSRRNSRARVCSWATNPTDAGRHAAMSITRTAIGSAVQVAWVTVLETLARDPDPSDRAGSAALPVRWDLAASNEVVEGVVEVVGEQAFLSGGARRVEQLARGEPAGIGGEHGRDEVTELGEREGLRSRRGVRRHHELRRDEPRGRSDLRG